MEDELIGASIQVASFLMSILGVTLQRRAMIVEEAPSDDALLVVPMHEDEDEVNYLDGRDEDGDEEDRRGDGNGNAEWNIVLRREDIDALRESTSSTTSVPTTATTPLQQLAVPPSTHPKQLEEDEEEDEHQDHRHQATTRCGRFCARRCHCCYHRVITPCVHVSKMWLLGFCTFYLSQVVEIFALNFASQSTIVAVGSLSTFVNAIVAVRVFHEPFQFLPPKSERRWRRKLFKWDLLNLMIIVAGGVCTVIFAPRVSEEEEHSFNAEKLLHKWIEMPFIVFFIASVVLVSVLLSRFFIIKRGPLVLALSLGTLNSFSITLSKIVTQLVNRNDLFNLRALVMISVWVFLLLTQVVLLQIGLRNFEQSGAFSISGVFGGAMTITSGMLYYQTYKNFESEGAIYGFAVGVVLMLYGILVFSQRKNLTREEMRRRLFADTIALEEEDEQTALRARLLSAAGAEDAPVPIYNAIVPSNRIVNGEAPDLL